MCSVLKVMESKLVIHTLTTELCNFVNWHEHLDPAILRCPADSVCGRAIIAYAKAAEEFMFLIDSDPDSTVEGVGEGALEEETKQHIVEAVVHQANVVYFG
jgi:hypothetical protein